MRVPEVVNVCVPVMVNHGVPVGACVRAVYTGHLCMLCTDSLLSVQWVPARPLFGCLSGVVYDKEMGTVPQRGDKWMRKHQLESHPPDQTKSRQAITFPNRRRDDLRTGDT
jgi:hypothetical protein